MHRTWKFHQDRAMDLSANGEKMLQKSIIIKNQRFPVEIPHLAPTWQSTPYGRCLDTPTFTLIGSQAAVVLYFVFFANSVFSFLADRTNGRAIATLLRLSSSSVVVCDVMYCG